jgi:hypothetical protein
MRRTALQGRPESLLPIDVDELFTRGGRPLIDFLEYCVFSVRVDPMFAYLVKNYREIPTVTGAIALYDGFCAPDAPARISAAELLPPRDRRLLEFMELLRGRCDAIREQAEAQGEPPPRLPAPPHSLFDPLTEILLRSGGPVQAAAEVFIPELEPHEQLDGGHMNAGQRAFVENVWRAHLRPSLAAAGFFRIANVG